MTELRIKYRRPASLTCYANNARTHSDEQVQQIVASIKEFGFTNPLLIDEQGGIIAGHGRHAAAIAMNLDTVPTITLAGLTEAQRRAYVIADNKLALNAGWDLKMLSIEFDALKAMDFNLDLTGFSGAEMTTLLVDRAEGETDPLASWSGMPSFDQQDLMAWRTIKVHFKCQADLDAFAKLIGQRITEKTRFVWHPKAAIAIVADKQYSDA